MPANGVRIAPEDVQSHNLMGMVMTEANRPQTGEYHYRRVLELADAPDPIVLANLAWNLKNQGRIDEARRLYQEAAAAAPEVVETLLGWARMRRPTGISPARTRCWPAQSSCRPRILGRS